VAAQALVALGADLNRVRQQVIQVLAAHPADEAGLVVTGRLEIVDQRLTAIEQRVGIGPDTRDLDEQIEVVRTEKEAAVDAQDFDQAASLRDREKQLLADKAARREQRTAEYPTLPELAERCQQLADEVDRIRALLRQHGIDPQDKPA
jgi:hypothetical protein